MTRTLYALVDCNNFFVSCERIFRPELRNKPVAVLSNNDGCFVSRSNEAKAAGLPMGAPVFKYKQEVKLHDVTLFSANFELYGDISQRIVALLREETPLIEVYSIDECFVDLSEILIDDVNGWAHRVSARVLKEIGVPVSIGVAETKTLAKVASTYAKTHGDGICVIENSGQRRKLLSDLPIEDIWGVGWRTAPKLHDKGVSNALQLVEATDAWLAQQFNIAGLKMIDELRGIPRLGFGDKHEQRKTIMCSRSFGHRIRAYYQLESAIATFAAQAGYRLRDQGSVCRGVVAYLATGPKDPTPSRLTYLVKLEEATNDTGQLIAAALAGLEALYDEDRGYKKAGVILVDIMPHAAWQLSLLGDHGNRDEKAMLMSAVDRLNKRYGGGTVWHATEARRQANWQSKRELRSPRYTTQLNELPVLKT